MDGAYDSLIAANNVFEDYFKKCLHNPSTLTANFNNAQKEGLRCVTSNDGKVRFYSWDTWTGGTMHNFSDLVQYKNNNGIAVDRIREDGDPGYFYMDAYSIKAKDRTIYMAKYHAIGSTRDVGEGIVAYALKDGVLSNAKVFLTKTQSLDRIEYGFDFFSINDSNGVKPEIHFSNDLHTLYVPIVKKDGSFTKDFLIYVFDGNNYVFDKNAR